MKTFYPDVLKNFMIGNGMWNDLTCATYEKIGSGYTSKGYFFTFPLSLING